MSDPDTSPSTEASKTERRNLPSWMSSRQNVSNHDRTKQTSVGSPNKSDEGEKHKQAKGGGEPHLKENETSGLSSAFISASTNFSKLLEGVVFVLSGFVNPERSVLRSQALELGAMYQADWNSNCTLLVCAFPNTPKFRQVESDCGTIVSKEWISECYKEKKLVDIETYLMHAGKPWRKQSISHEKIPDREPPASKKSQKLLADREPSASKKSKNRVGKAAYSKPTPTASSKCVAPNPDQDYFPPSKVKKWAVDDFSKTISWLESQDERPDPSETKKIAAEGILTCLQDAIDYLKQEKEIRHISEQWNFVPQVVEELAKLEGCGDGNSIPKNHLYELAMAFKEIYEKELGNLDDSLVNDKKLKTGEHKRGSKERNEAPTGTATAEYDSDETIEMTEDDIDQAYNTIASTLSKC